MSLNRNAHWRVAKIARELAKAVFSNMHNDPVFAVLHPDEDAWVNANISKFLQPAREALVDAMASPELTPGQKDEILDVLAKDQALIPRKHARQRIVLA